MGKIVLKSNLLSAQSRGYSAGIFVEIIFNILQDLGCSCLIFLQFPNLCLVCRYLFNIQRVLSENSVKTTNNHGKLGHKNKNIWNKIKWKMSEIRNEVQNKSGHVCLWGKWGLVLQMGGRQSWLGHL